MQQDEQHKPEQTQQPETQPAPPEPTAEEKIQATVEQPDVSLQEGVDERKFDVEIEFEAIKANRQLHTWRGKKLVITAGPTYEKIDDVRFIGNYSSGKMGFALAEEAAKLGATVTLVAGPVSLTTPAGIHRINVESAIEMQKTVDKLTDSTDVFILAAAVADYMPVQKHDGKLKKSDTGETMTLELTQTPDILASLGERKKAGQFLIGFALETQNAEEYGRQKMEKKNCDMIVINVANQPDSGFGGDNNTNSILTRDGSLRSFPPMSKHECAREILGVAERFLR